MDGSVVLDKGFIIKALSGFYYVKTADAVITCKAKGVFRKKEVSPFVGDRVEIEPGENQEGIISKILPRKNEIVRPPVANLDLLGIVVSTCDPVPNTLVIDKLLTVAEYKGIEPVLIITKTDLFDSEKIESIYKKAGYVVFVVDYEQEETVTAVKQFLQGKVSAFTGNSGVGKSTLLNHMDSRFQIETGEISQKLGRGKHTTRHVELHPLHGGGYIADTPGFSTMEIARYDMILKEKLQYCFRDFADYIDNCQFTGCSHTVEKGCAVLEALEEGKIDPSRHNSYVSMYNDAKQIKEWDRK